MPSNLKETTIILSNSEQTPTQVKITDEAGNYYSFFKTKKSDGQPTRAYQQFQTLNHGDTATVVYEEKQGQGTTIFRNISLFKDIAVGAPVQPPVAQPDSIKATVPPGIPQFTMHKPFPASVDKSTFIEAQAIAKSLLESHQATPADIVNADWWATIVFPAINAMHSAAADNADNLNVEDIPF